MIDPNHPWRCWLRGLDAGRRSTRVAAMNIVDKPWRKGAAIVKHEGNGETWERRRLSWFKVEPARPKQKAPVKADAPAGRSAPTPAPAGAMDLAPGKSVAPAPACASRHEAPVQQTLDLVVSSQNSPEAGKP